MKKQKTFEQWNLLEVSTRFFLCKQDRKRNRATHY